jgi:hypothetical protein
MTLSGHLLKCSCGPRCGGYSSEVPVACRLSSPVFLYSSMTPSSVNFLIFHLVNQRAGRSPPTVKVSGLWSDPIDIKEGLAGNLVKSILKSKSIQAKPIHHFLHVFRATLLPHGQSPHYPVEGQRRAVRARRSLKCQPPGVL